MHDAYVLYWKSYQFRLSQERQSIECGVEKLVFERFQDTRLKGEGWSDNEVIQVTRRPGIYILVASSFIWWHWIIRFFNNSRRSTRGIAGRKHKVDIRPRFARILRWISLLSTRLYGIYLRSFWTVGPINPLGIGISLDSLQPRDWQGEGNRSRENDGKEGAWPEELNQKERIQKESRFYTEIDFPIDLEMW